MPVFAEFPAFSRFPFFSARYSSPELWPNCQPVRQSAGGELAQIGHQRTSQDQVVQVDDFFFFGQEGHFAAGHVRIMLERRIVSGLIGFDLAAA